MEPNDYAIVTGAGSGIGRALTIELSREPVTVIAVGRSEAPLMETAAKAPGRIQVVPADISEISEYHKIIAVLSAGNATVKYLVHGAGLCAIERTADITPETWRKTMGTNVDGRLFLTLHLLPWLKEGSRVLFVGSNSATTPRAGCTAYCVSKAASYMLQECLKLELSRRGILVGIAIPSPVYTPLLVNQMNADPEIFPDGEEYRRLFSEGQLISSRAVARFYRWLLTAVQDSDYSARQWNIQDASHHPLWLGREDLYHSAAAESPDPEKP